MRKLASQVDPAAVAEELRRRISESIEPGVDIGELERKRARLARRRRDLLLSDADFVREGLEVLAEEDTRLANEIEIAKRQRQPASFDLESAIRSAVEAAVALEGLDTEEGRDAAQVALRAFVQEIRVMPSPLRKATRVELTTRQHPQRGGLPALA